MKVEKKNQLTEYLETFQLTKFVGPMMSDKNIRNVHNRIVVKSTRGLSSCLLNLTVDLQNNYATILMKNMLLRIYNIQKNTYDKRTTFKYSNILSNEPLLSSKNTIRRNTLYDDND